MTVQELYEKLLQYDEESNYTKRYWYNLSNGFTEIHRRDDNSTWFLLHNDGTIRQEYRFTDDHIEYNTFDELQGDDFEFFNNLQIFKSGYIVFEDAKTKYDVKKIITNLYHYIDSFDPENFIFDELDDDYKYPALCGCTSLDSRMMTDNFEYYTRDGNGIFATLMTIDNLVKTNVSRKHYGVKCIPYKRNMKAGNSVYMTFASNIKNRHDNYIYKECNKAVREVMGYLDELGIDAKWVNVNCKHPLYL